MIKVLKFDDHVRISKFEKSFAKVYKSNSSKEIFVIKKVRNISWTYVIANHNSEETVGSF